MNIIISLMKSMLLYSKVTRKAGVYMSPHSIPILQYPHHQSFQTKILVMASRQYNFQISFLSPSDIYMPQWFSSDLPESINTSMVKYWEFPWRIVHLAKGNMIQVQSYQTSSSLHCAKYSKWIFWTGYVPIETCTNRYYTFPIGMLPRKRGQNQDKHSYNNTIGSYRPSRQSIPSRYPRTWFSYNQRNF